MHGRIATTRAGAKKNQLSDQIGMAECDFLGLKTTDRKPEEIDLRQSEGPDHRCDVVGHLFHSVARRARRGGDPATVEEDHLASFGQPVSDHGVPVVHATAEVLDEEQWWGTRALAPAPIGKAISIDLDEASGRIQVAYRHDFLLMFMGRRARSGFRPSS
jgi:hypothetical protein